MKRLANVIVRGVAGDQFYSAPVLVNERGRLTVDAGQAKLLPAAPKPTGSSTRDAITTRLDDMVYRGPRDGKEHRFAAYATADGHVVIAAPKPSRIASKTTRDTRQRITQLERTMRSFDETVSSGNVSLGRSNYAEPDHEDTEAGEEIASYHERDYSVTRDRGGVYRVRRRRQARRDRREETGRTDDADRSPTAIMTLDGTARDSHPAALTKLGDYLNNFWAAKKAVS